MGEKRIHICQVIRKPIMDKKVIEWKPSFVPHFEL